MHMHVHIMSLVQQCSLSLAHTHTHTLAHSPHLTAHIHTSIVHDVLHHILNLLKAQSQLRALPLIAVDSGCHSSGEVARFDGLKAIITNGVEKQEGFLADLDPLVVEDSIRFPSLQPTV